jgi:hypothetical protein
MKCTPKEKDDTMATTLSLTNDFGNLHTINPQQSDIEPTGEVIISEPVVAVLETEEGRTEFRAIVKVRQTAAYLYRTGVFVQNLDNPELSFNLGGGWLSWLDLPNAEIFGDRDRLDTIDERLNDHTKDPDFLADYEAKYGRKMGGGE